MAADLHRVEIGFEGGQVVAAKLDDDQVKSLRKALGKEDTHEFETEGETVVLDVSKVIFLRILADESRLGFRG